MATDGFDSTLETDQFGNPTKKKQDTGFGSLPTLQPNQPATLSPAALNGFGATPNAPAAQPIKPTAEGTTQGNTDILAKAQTDVLSQPQQSNLQGLTTKQTENFVLNPMGDFNGAKNKQAQLEKADTDWAKTFEAQRQQYGNASGSGLLQQNMLNNALKHNVDQQTLGAQADQDNYQRYIDSMTKALAAGQSQTQSNENVFSQRLGNLGTVRSMAEGERSQTSSQSHDIAMQNLNAESQTALTKLQGDIDTGKLIRQEDFQATQANIDRALELAKQKNDIEATTALTQLKGQIDAKAQAAQQTWSSAERIANQGWQTGENVRKEDLDAAMQYNKIQAEKAAQDKDIDAQKYLANQKNMLDLQMQTNGMNEQEKMARLTSDLAEARANNDVSRQQIIIGFQTTQEMAKIDKEQGFQAAQTDIQNKLKLAMQTNDFVQAQVLQMNQLGMQSLELDKQDEWKKAELQLRDKQIDLAGKQFDYSTLMDAVKAGTVDPGAAVGAVQAAMKQYDIKVKTPDPQASQKAIEKQYDDMKFQFGLTNPNLKNADGTLNAAGEQAFNGFFNKTTMGMDSNTSISVKNSDGKTSTEKVSITVDKNESGMNSQGINLGSGFPAYWSSKSNSWTPIAPEQIVTFSDNMKAKAGVMPAGTYKMTKDPSGFYVYQNVNDPKEKYLAYNSQPGENAEAYKKAGIKQVV